MTIACDYCGLAPHGRTAVWYVAAAEPASALTASRFVCDDAQHLRQAKAVVGHGGCATTVTALPGSRATR